LRAAKSKHRAAAAAAAASTLWNGMRQCRKGQSSKPNHPEAVNTLSNLSNTIKRIRLLLEGMQYVDTVVLWLRWEC
jgi:hypothetical protein